MTTPLVASPFCAPIPNTLKKRRVLLVDTSPAKRHLRAEVMRRLGMDVDCAADIPEARSWWKVDFYDLVLINMEEGLGHRDRFCEDIRNATPPQQLAFLVGKPDYLADSPSADPPIQQDVGDVPVADVRAALSADLGDLPQRWGILEASRRISAVRSAFNARTQAMRNKPEPPRDLETRYAKHAAAESRTLDELLREEMQ
jgi:CheY-like chemotaxis protein